MSGEALSRTHRRRSALTAIDDWVRGRAGRDPSRTARHGGQAQFHCGYPPPAAEPSTRTHMSIGGPPSSGGRSRAETERRRTAPPDASPPGPGRVRLVPVVLEDRKSVV